MRYGFNPLEIPIRAPSTYALTPRPRVSIINAASREFDVPAAQLELEASRGALRVIQLDNGPDDGQDGARWLLRPDVEQFVKRTIKRGAGNKVVTRINR